MHRSGTSLVASALEKAGLHIGRDVTTPGLGNPRGHFEDPDFLQLHEDMLAAAGETCFTAGDAFAPPASRELESRARALVAQRDELPLWGWKDPRTCLFLDFWDPILPRACYLLLYRHPVDVALSLWRRSNDLELWQDPSLAVRAWEVYNRRLLELHRRHPERSFLAQVPAVTADLDELVCRLREKLGLPLRDGRAAAVFIPEELTSLASPDGSWGQLIPGALALYRRLEESADLPAAAPAGADAGRPARERELLRSNEILLYALLQRRTPGSVAPPPVELRQAYHRLRVQQEAVGSCDEPAPGRSRITALERAILHEQQRVTELAAALSHELQDHQQDHQKLQADLDAERRQASGLAAALDRERRRAAQAEARNAELARVLAEIEGSRSFAPVRVWWWLRHRLGRQRR